MIYRFFQWGVAGVWFLSAILINRFPVGLWWWLVAGVLIDSGIIVLYAQHSRVNRWSFYLPWLMGAYASLLLLMFLDRPLFRHLWIASIAIAGVLYWYRVDKWVHAPAEQDSQMVQLASLWLALAVGAGGITLYAWQIFVGQSAWFSAFLLVALMSATTVNMWKLEHTTFSTDIFLYLIILVLVAFELFWVVGFSTFGFASKGFIWASGVWYSWWLVGLIQRKEVNLARAVKGTTVLFTSWLLIFFLTRWF